MSFMYLNVTSPYCCNYLSPPYHSLSIRQEAEKLTSTRHLKEILKYSGMATAIMVTIKQTKKNSLQEMNKFLLAIQQSSRYIGSSVS